MLRWVCLEKDPCKAAASAFKGVWKASWKRESGHPREDEGVLLPLNEAVLAEHPPNSARSSRRWRYTTLINETYGLFACSVLNIFFVALRNHDFVYCGLLKCAAASMGQRRRGNTRSFGLERRDSWLGIEPSARRRFQTILHPPVLPTVT